MLQHHFACSYTNCELVRNCVKMIQTSSQIQYLRQFVHVLPFSAIKLVYLVAKSFYLFVCKKWTCEKLFTNYSNKILNSTLKATYERSTILSNKTVIFSRNIFLHVRMQIVRTRENLWKNNLNTISNSIFKANWTMFYHSKL